MRNLDFSKFGSFSFYGFFSTDGAQYFDFSPLGFGFSCHEKNKVTHTKGHFLGFTDILFGSIPPLFEGGWWDNPVWSWQPISWLIAFSIRVATLKFQGDSRCRMEELRQLEWLLLGAPESNASDLGEKSFVEKIGQVPAICLVSIFHFWYV